MPKEGHAVGECDDAVAVAGGGTGALRMAVADGATESLLSGPWAELLVGVFVEDPGPTPVATVIGRARSRWPDVLRAFREEREAAGDPFTWVDDAALARGAWSTLVGVRVGVGEVTVVAVGDSCAFLERSTGVVVPFPIGESGAFGSTPDLIAAEPAHQPAPPAAATWRAPVVPGDRVHLATDALSEWVLRGIERGEAPLRVLREAATAGGTGRAFAELVAAERGAGRLREDDTTYALVDVS